ncbi:ATP-binding cassette domain-containing protein [Aliarcobacter sp.]|uniref:ATP-binding cassette domain-containing protein n=1 Tax=Aliarcobacter sp. TaxID=2321116 RepID=UPI0035674A33
MSKNILKIENLNLYYDKKQVLKDLNLNIEKNSITAISGPSGIGKSSLLLVLNQMIKEYENASFSGKVYFNDDNKDIDITTLSNKELPNLRKKIVYVSQHPDILPFSIFENLYFPLKLQKIKKDDAKKLITEVLKIENLILELKKSCTIVIISHFKSQILNVADSIFKIE